MVDPKFHILPDDFTVGGGQLTPTVTVRRDIVLEQYAEAVGALCS